MVDSYPSEVGSSVCGSAPRSVQVDVDCRLIGVGVKNSSCFRAAEISEDLLRHLPVFFGSARHESHKLINLPAQIGPCAVGEIKWRAGNLLIRSTLSFSRVSDGFTVDMSTSSVPEVENGFVPVVIGSFTHKCLLGGVGNIKAY